MKNIINFVCVVVIAMVLNGCDARWDAIQASKETARNALSSVAIPNVSYFQERRTIAKWATRWDKPSVITYVYLVSYGKVLGYYIADGKPASTRSYLTPEDRAADQGAVISLPDIDGTYGDNNPGIRFFTAEGTAVEWGGDGATYLYSDTPINFGYDVPKLGGKLPAEKDSSK